LSTFNLHIIQLPENFGDANISDMGKEVLQEEITDPMALKIEVKT
jgi:hypothetical protein